MISKEKVFFLNQLIDSMEKAVEKFEAASPREKTDLIRFILSVQSEIKDLILVIK